jgi:2-polyprenyl-6-methoxyphenol hydroxylase-like FAD-dependent oxidoreductase
MVFSLAIVGAGPAGLTLARLMQVSDVNTTTTVFERDASPTARTSQGGTLDLHTDTGLAALRKCQLWEEAVTHLRFDGQELTIADQNDTHIVHQKDIPPMKTKESQGKLDYERPEMDREVLKDILLKSVDPSTVKWGKILQSMDPTTGVLSFRDGSTAGPFDLVVGADGAWSKVRHVLTNVRPSYSGIVGFSCDILNPDKVDPRLSKMVGRGSYFAYSDGRFLGGQRMGDESIKVGIYLKRDYPGGENWASDIMAAHGDNEAALKERILEEFQGWVPVQKEFVRTGTNFRQWPLYELPVGEFWEHKQGVTLVGDAASLMTPFAGEGVNKAMRDCLELAEKLEKAVKNNTSVDDAVRDYEQVMFPRAKRWQAVTLRNKGATFSKEGQSKFLVDMIDDIGEEMGWDLKKGFISYVPLKTIMWSYVVSRQWIGSWRRTLSGLIWKEV